jgi:PAS domain S-box-containing protein
LSFIVVVEDVTRRKKISAERESLLTKIQQERDKLHTLLDSMTDEVWFYDGEGNLALANLAAARGLGFERGEEMYQTMPEWLAKLKIYNPDDKPRPETEAPLLRSLQGETLYNVEEKVRHPKTGEMMYRQVNSAPLESEKGEILGAVAVVRDITERKQAERELQLLMELTRTISQAVDFDEALQRTLTFICEETKWVFGEVWLPNEDRSVLKASKIYYCGEADGEALKQFRQVSQTSTFPPGVGLPGRVWASKQPQYNWDVSQSAVDDYLHANREAQAARLKFAVGVPIAIDDEVMAVLVLYQTEDYEVEEQLVQLISAVAVQLGTILKHKQMEAALRANERFLQTIFNKAEIAIIVIDVTEAGEFVIAAFNPAAERMSGRSSQTITGKELSGLEPQMNSKVVDTLISRYRQSVESGETVEFELAVPRQEGEEKWLVKVEPLQDERRRVYRLIVTAVALSKRKYIEHRLQRVNEILSALNEWHRLLLNSDDETEILLEMCRIIVEIANYHSVWIGFAEQDEEAQRVRPVAHMCIDEEELSTLDISWTKTEMKQYPAGRAIRSGHTVLISNVETDVDYEPWRDQATRWGYTATIALPIADEHGPLGALTIYSEEPDVFDAQEVSLLQKLADNLAYGIRIFRQKEDNDDQVRQ